MQLSTIARRCYLEPDKPLIENIEMGYDFVNVSWRSSVDEPSTNPASEFVVEYQLQHGAALVLPITMLMKELLLFRFSFRSYLRY